jgi:hypothetical protein
MIRATAETLRINVIAGVQFGQAPRHGMEAAHAQAYQLHTAVKAVLRELRTKEFN